MIKKLLICILFISIVNAEDIFNELESNLFKAMINDELETIAKDGEATFVENGLFVLPQKVSSDKIQKEYEKNEVKADLEYGNKLLLITGKVDTIQKDIANNLIVKIKGGNNTFIMPTAQIQKKYINWVASINKGNNIKLVCENKGLFVGMVNLINCTPFDNWLVEQNLESKIFNYYKDNKNVKNELTEYISKMIDFTKLIATKIDTQKSSCTTQNFNDKKCLQEMSKIVEVIQKEKNSK
ncbi:OB-fold putative lipoprotein [Arcobacter lacus]|uniref:OB-fold putative lipoprotein n=1 Tax=Arcobacteraceae TaxID=2808963 RepID=UPI001EDA8DF1|nr:MULTISPECIES: OB-fold putative lipoprotein [Arcobacteraceae]MCG3684057.1 OB-fold putative lipoprotein [Aliarcobacter butzleri]MCT7908765.1 OB-fold putative lipoprotein [Arcobacter lacus]